MDVRDIDIHILKYAKSWEKTPKLYTNKSIIYEHFVNEIFYNYYIRNFYDKNKLLLHICDKIITFVTIVDCIIILLYSKHFSELCSNNYYNFNKIQ